MLGQVMKLQQRNVSKVFFLISSPAQNLYNSNQFMIYTSKSTTITGQTKKSLDSMIHQTQMFREKL